MQGINELLEIVKAMPYTHYGIAFLAIVFGSFIARVITRIINQSLRVLFKKNNLEHDYIAVQKRITLVFPLQLIVIGWSVLIAISVLNVSSSVLNFCFQLAKVLSYLGAIWTGLQVASIIETFLVGKAAKTETKFDDLLAPLIGRSLKVAVWIVGFVSVAELLKLPLASLLTGLGIGGLALAMAAKDTIANIFGSITIIADRPFNIGDWVKIGDVEGTVENLGFRSTKVRTFYNSLITVPNVNLLTASVDNMGARTYRRFSTNLSITYDTSPEQAEAFCEGVRNLIKEHPQTRKDYFLVHVNQLAASSIDVMLYCFFKVPDWNQELAARESLILSIMRLANDLNVSFAFPTQTIHVEKTIPSTELN